MALSYKEGDTRPSLRGILIDAYGEPLDLTNATSVYAAHKKPGGPVSGEHHAQIIGDPKNGEVEIAWGVNDLSPPGMHYLEFRVYWADGTHQTVPNSGLVDIKVDAILPLLQLL